MKRVVEPEPAPEVSSPSDGGQEAPRGAAFEEMDEFPVAVGVLLAVSVTGFILAAVLL